MKAGRAGVPLPVNQERCAYEDHYRAIGRAVVAAARLDGQVASLLWSLIGPDQFVGELITAKLGFRQRVALLRSLIAHKAKDDRLDELAAAFENHALAAMKGRDDLAHSDWGVSVSRDGLVFRSKATPRPKTGLEHDVERLSVRDIDLIADELEACGQMLMNNLFDACLPHMHGVAIVASRPDGTVEVTRPRPERRNG